MPHLLGNPHWMLTSRQHHRCVGMPRLVRPAVPDAGFLHRWHPHGFPDRSVTGPSFKRAWILEDLDVSQERVSLLCFQCLQRGSEQLHAAAPSGGLCSRCLPLAGLSHSSAHHHFPAQPVNIVPIQGHELAGAQANPESELHHVARLSRQGAQHGLLFLGAKWINVILSRRRSLA